MFYGRYTRRDREEKQILFALDNQDAPQIARILAPHRSRWGKLKLALGLTLTPCTTAAFGLAVERGDLENVKLLDRGHSSFLRGFALQRAAHLGCLPLVQWFSQVSPVRIKARDFASAVLFSAVHGHLECMQSLRHKWHTIDHPERMLSDVAANGHKDMLRFLLNDFPTPHSKEGWVNLTLLHMGAFRSWEGIEFIAQSFPELDDSVFKEVLLKFGQTNLNITRTRLDRGQLQATTQKTSRVAILRRI